MVKLDQVLGKELKRKSVIRNRVVVATSVHGPAYDTDYGQYGLEGKPEYELISALKIQLTEEDEFPEEPYTSAFPFKNSLFRHEKYKI